MTAKGVTVGNNRGGAKTKAETIDNNETKKEREIIAQGKVTVAIANGIETVVVKTKTKGEKVVKVTEDKKGNLRKTMITGVKIIFTGKKKTDLKRGQISTMIIPTRNKISMTGKIRRGSGKMNIPMTERMGTKMMMKIGQK